MNVIDQKIDILMNQIYNSLDLKNYKFDSRNLNELVKDFAYNLITGDPEIHRDCELLQEAIRKKNFDDVKKYYNKIKFLIFEDEHPLDHRRGVTIENSFWANQESILDLVCIHFNEKIIEFFIKEFSYLYVDLFSLILKKYLNRYLDFLLAKKIEFDPIIALSHYDDEKYILRLINEFGLDLTCPHLLKNQLNSFYSQNVPSKIIVLYKNGANDPKQIELLLHECKQIIKERLDECKYQYIKEIIDFFAREGYSFELDSNSFNEIYFLSKYQFDRKYIYKITEFIISRFCFLTETPSRHEISAYKKILDLIFQKIGESFTDRTDNELIEVHRRLFLFNSAKALQMKNVDPSVIEEFSNLINLAEINL